jgi:hypothetical protein
MRLLRRDRGLALMLGLIMLPPMGCSAPVEDNLPREAISGTVMLDGQPLPKGTIQFRPASQEATAAGGMIDDGRFAIPRSEGLVPGKYKVQIDSREDAGAPLAGGELPGAPVVSKKKPAALIPARFNTMTELTAEVRSGGPNDFTFDLRK